MKYGIRKPSLKKSISARTTGRAKRALKRAVNPLYGKKGMGWVNNPKKAAYNKVYNRTSVSAGSSIGCLATIIFFPFVIAFNLFKLLCLGLAWLVEGIIGLISGSSNPADNDTTEPVAPSIPPVSKLSDVPDRWTKRVPIFQNCPQLYGYIRVRVTDADPDILRQMLSDDGYSLDPTLCADGSVGLLYNNIYVAKLAERVEMCADWLRRGDPIRCEMTGFHPGKEHVFLGFYRDEAARLQGHETAVVKLTTYTAEAKQDSIRLLVSGEKLSCAEDNNTDSKVNVLDFDGDLVGRLPKKYADIFLDEGLSGIFFDHADEDNIGRLVPYVKIFL